MYIRNPIPSYNGLGQSDPNFNPPAYYQTMATDPTQVPYQYWPGSGVNGPYPGWYVGQRVFTQEDAIRDARRRQAALEMKAEVSNEPEDKYIQPQGKLTPQSQLIMAEAARIHAPGKQEVSIEQRVITSVLLGAAISALLR